MRPLIFGLWAAASLAGGVASAQTPPIASGPLESGPTVAAAIAEQSGEAACDGQALTAVHAESMDAVLLTSAYEGSDRSAYAEDLELSFTIDPDGRPRDIRGPSNGRGSTAGIGYWDDEAKAALAVSRFAGGARGDCRLTVHRSLTPMTVALPAALARGFGTARTGDPARQTARALLAPDCLTLPALDVAAYPDLSRGSVPPGGRAWTVVRFDVSADGTTRAVSTLESTGDAAFDAEGRRSVSATRFRDGSSRSGCIVSFGRSGEPQPDAPDPEPTGDILQSCPAEVRARFTPSRLQFPPAFLRRGVEGWAIVRFDIATWGAIGNVEVLQSQPADTFGLQAQRIIQQGRASPGFTPGVRCVDRVIFKMAEAASPGDPSAVEPLRD